MATTFFRTGFWFMKGMREYTRSGYEAAAKDFDSLEGIDVSGRSFLITGANSGIGKETALALAKMGGTVHMVCRNEERGQLAVDEVKNISKNTKVYLHIVDVSRPRKVQEFTQSFIAGNVPLNVLVNNAGCLLNTRQLTDDGLETMFATNTLGAFLLTSGLVGHLQKFDSPQVITVTSGSMLLMTVDSKDLQFEQITSFDGPLAYAQTKRQQVVVMDRFSIQYPRIQFSTMHPGWADTPAVRSSMPDFHRHMANRLRTPQQGADTLIWLCASSTAREQPTGGFYQDRLAVSKHLPLAWTKVPEKDELEFMTKVEKLVTKFVCGE